MVGCRVSTEPVRMPRGSEGWLLYHQAQLVQATATALTTHPPPTPTLHCRVWALSSVITPPMAAGMRTSQGTARIASLAISVPPGKAARLRGGRAQAGR